MGTGIYIEWKTLGDFLLRKNALQMGDYIYEHHNDECPKKPSDASKLFFVVGIDGDKLKVHSYTNEEKEIILKNLQGNWWVLELTPDIRKRGGMGY